MDLKQVSAYVVVLLSVFGGYAAFFEGCNYTYPLAAGQPFNILSPNYELGYSYQPGSSCKYIFSAPVDYQVRASCSINLYDASNKDCTSERFYFATDGRVDLSTSYYYCGAKSISLTSVGNTMVLAYISAGYTGKFSCTLSTVCDCGWSVTSRIVNGAEAGVNEFPPMAGLAAVSSSVFFCGAAIISKDYVVTAAHCLEVSPPERTAVVVGEHNITTGAETSFTKAYLVTRFVKHPAYSNVTQVNDIGLVQTASPIIWSRAVAPVCLPFFYSAADFSGQKTTATGFGSTSFGGPSSKVLLKVILNVLSNSNTLCSSPYPTIQSTQMCAFAPYKDTCQYDSGGPLFYSGSGDPHLFLIGLVSYGSGCGGLTPSVNTRITSYLSWIESICSATTNFCRRAMLQ